MAKAWVGFLLSALLFNVMSLRGMTLDEAYAALRARNYQDAIRGFEQGEA